jgi:hypothetical protein
MPNRLVGCVRCGRFAEHWARGLCRPCYQAELGHGTHVNYPLGSALPRVVWQWHCEACEQWSFATFISQEEARHWEAAHLLVCTAR